MFRRDWWTRQAILAREGRFLTAIAVAFGVPALVMADGAEFLAGNGRYRLEVPRADPDPMAETVTAGSDHSKTTPWVKDPGPFWPPDLTELLGKEIGNRILLVKPEYWIGS